MVIMVASNVGGRGWFDHLSDQMKDAESDNVSEWSDLSTRPGLLF